MQLRNFSWLAAIDRHATVHRKNRIIRTAWSASRDQKTSSPSVTSAGLIDLAADGAPRTNTRSAHGDANLHSSIDNILVRVDMSVMRRTASPHVSQDLMFTADD